MAKLLLQTGLPPGVELELRQGVTRIGRGPANDVQIADPSVSTTHCVLLVEGEQVQVRDLGSTNGTYVDGEPVTLARLRPDQVLRLGSVELLFPPLGPSLAPVGLPRATDAPVAPASPSVSAADLRDSPVRPAGMPALPARRASSARRPVAAPGSRRDQTTRLAASESFFTLASGAFAYPSKRDGAILLTGGALFLGLMDFLMRWVSLLGLVVTVITYGYLAAYMQKIVASSAQGETHLPPWPDFGNFWDDLIEPFVQMLATALLCFLPATWVAVADGPVALRLGLEVLGNVYFPLAWLAVSLTQSLAGLNPLVILPTVFRLPAQVLALTAINWLVFQALVRSDAILETALSIAALPLPGVTTVALKFATLYLLTVQMRIIGLFYFANGGRLRWF